MSCCKTDSLWQKSYKNKKEKFILSVCSSANSVLCIVYRMSRILYVKVLEQPKFHLPEFFFLFLQNYLSAIFVLADCAI